MKLLPVILLALFIGICVVIGWILTPIAIIWQAADSNATDVYKWLDKGGYKTGVESKEQKVTFMEKLDKAMEERKRNIL